MGAQPDLTDFSSHSFMITNFTLFRCCFGWFSFDFRTMLPRTGATVRLHWREQVALVFPFLLGPLLFFCFVHWFCWWRRAPSICGGRPPGCVAPARLRRLSPNDISQTRMDQSHNPAVVFCFLLLFSFLGFNRLSMRCVCGPPLNRVLPSFAYRSAQATHFTVWISNAKRSRTELNAIELNEISRVQ